MQNVEEQFRKNPSLWTSQDKQTLEQFFLSNPFFSKFYQTKKLVQIARMCLYRQLGSGETLTLENNNRAEVIVLLSGNCIVKKKQTRQKKKPKMYDSKQQQQKSPKRQRYEHNSTQEYFEYIFLAHLQQPNQTLTLNSQSTIQVPQSKSASLIFIPCALHHDLQNQIQHERVDKIYQVLQRFFFRLKKKQIHQLSQANCTFREFKMNNYIYRAASKPEEAYLLLQGMVKLEKPGFSQQTLKQTLLTNSGMIFGDSDIKLDERLRDAVACTALIEVLTIPKTYFLKYAQKAFPDLVFDQEKSSPIKLPKLDDNLRLSHSLRVSSTKQSLLPFIRRQSHFRESSLNAQNKRTQSQQKRQYDLIRNSHMLLDINAKTEKKFQLRKFSPKTKQEMQKLFKNQKSKLKQLKMQSRFSLNNSLLNL